MIPVLFETRLSSKLDVYFSKLDVYFSKLDVYFSKLDYTKKSNGAFVWDFFVLVTLPVL